MNRNRGCLPSPRSTVLDRAAASEAGSANVVSGGLRVGGSCEYYGWPSVTIRIISDNMPDDKTSLFSYSQSTVLILPSVDRSEKKNETKFSSHACPSFK